MSFAQDLSNHELATAIIESLSDFDSFVAKDPKAALEEADPWLMFPHPSGRGHRLSGPRTRKLLVELTKRALANSRLDGRADFDKTFRKIMIGFADQVVSKGTAPTDELVTKLLFQSTEVR